jgi:hypothetical protein
MAAATPAGPVVAELGDHSRERGDLALVVSTKFRDQALNFTLLLRSELQITDDALLPGVPPAAPLAPLFVQALALLGRKRLPDGAVESLHLLPQRSGREPFLGKERVPALAIRRVPLVGFGPGFLSRSLETPELVGVLRGEVCNQPVHLLALGGRDLGGIEGRGQVLDRVTIVEAGSGCVVRCCGGHALRPGQVSGQVALIAPAPGKGNGESRDGQGQNSQAQIESEAPAGWPGMSLAWHSGLLRGR